MAVWSYGLALLLNSLLYKTEASSIMLTVDGESVGEERRGAVGQRQSRPDLAFGAEELPSSIGASRG